MIYGKLFKKYMELFGQVEFSNNRVSGLTEEELIVMAHNLYQILPEEMDKYYEKNEKDLVELIFNTLQKI